MAAATISEARVAEATTFLKIEDFLIGDELQALVIRIRDATFTEDDHLTYSTKLGLGLRKDLGVLDPATYSGEKAAAAEAFIAKFDSLMGDPLLDVAKFTFEVAKQILNNDDELEIYKGMHASQLTHLYRTLEGPLNSDSAIRLAFRAFNSASNE